VAGRAPFHVGEEIWRETDTPGQFPEGVAFLQAELADRSVEGVFNNATYKLDTPPLSTTNGTADNYAPER
jgi:hypothetical protein